MKMITLFNSLKFCFSVNQVKYGPRHKKICLRGFLNNKGADQPAHLRRLISAFVIHLLESIIAEQVGLGMTWSETPKTGFVALRPISAAVK